MRMAKKGMSKVLGWSTYAPQGWQWSGGDPISWVRNDEKANRVQQQQHEVGK